MSAFCTLPSRAFDCVFFKASQLILLGLPNLNSVIVHSNYKTSFVGHLLRCCSRRHLCAQVFPSTSTE